MDKEALICGINRMKKEQNAVIVAHSYQVDDVQEIADVVGDSFALSQFCASNSASTIVFCGVHFMAESAKILAPEKTVLLPEINAGCPMADMVTAEALREAKQKYPDAAVVCYINSTADVKAECDVCCTSSNALKVIRSIDKKDILFVPDKNLGSYVAQMVPEKNIILWEGYCITHHKIRTNEVLEAKRLHPEAILLVHPECQPEITALADYVGSTKQIIDYARNSKHDKFIIGTEMGVLYQLKKDNPGKTFYMMSTGLICPNMKKTSLQSVYDALANKRYEIILDEDIIKRASSCLNRMLEVSK